MALHPRLGRYLLAAGRKVRLSPWTRPVAASASAAVRVHVPFAGHGGRARVCISWRNACREFCSRTPASRSPCQPRLSRRHLSPLWSARGCATRPFFAWALHHPRTRPWCGAGRSRTSCARALSQRRTQPRCLSAARADRASTRGPTWRPTKRATRWSRPRCTPRLFPSRLKGEVAPTRWSCGTG